MEKKNATTKTRKNQNLTLLQAIETVAENSRDSKMSPDFMKASAFEIKFLAESLNNGENISDVAGIEAKMGEVQNEGLIGGILGGITGIAVGDKIGNAICKALGITTGPLYQLLNSKIVTTAICTYLGIKI